MGQPHRPLGIRSAVIAEVLRRSIAPRLVVPGMEPAAHERSMHEPARALAIDNGTTQGRRVPPAARLSLELVLDCRAGRSSREVVEFMGI
jgi:hypothetical protein